MRKYLFIKMWTRSPHGCRCGRSEGHRYTRLWSREFLTGRCSWCWRTWVTNTFGFYRWGQGKPWWKGIHLAWMRRAVKAENQRRADWEMFRAGLKAESET